MKKHLIIVGLVILIILIGLSGCLGDKGKFVGQWKNGWGIIVYTFNDDDTYHGTVTSGTYEIKDGKLICKSDPFIFTYEFEFLENDNTLILNGIGGADSFTLTRVRN